MTALTGKGLKEASKYEKFKMVLLKDARLMVITNLRIVNRAHLGSIATAINFISESDLELITLSDTIIGRFTCFFLFVNTWGAGLGWCLVTS